MDTERENKQDIDPWDQENQAAMHSKDHRLLNTRWDGHGCLEIQARLTPEQGVLVIKALEAAVDSLAGSEPSDTSDSHTLENTPAGASTDDDALLQAANKRHPRRRADALIVRRQFFHRMFSQLTIGRQLTAKDRQQRRFAVFVVDIQRVITGDCLR